MHPEALAAARVLQAHLYRRLGRRSPPRMAHLYLTFRCAPRCAACTACDPERWPELDTAGAAALLGRLIGLDVLKVLGGDVFARDDVGALVGYMRRRIRPAILQLNTTGAHPARVAEVMAAHGGPGLHLRISLEGGRALHDRRRHEGAFDRVLETLDRLEPLRDRGFSVGLNVHVTDEALGDLPAIARLCQERGLGFFPGIPVKPTLFHHSPEALAGLGLPVSDLGAYRAALEAAGVRRDSGYRRAAARFLGRGNRTLLDRLEREGPNLRFDCRELRSLIYVLPTGDVVPCGLRPRPVGNLLRQDLRTILAGPEAEAARREVAACPGCYQTSVQLISRLYGGRSLS